MKLFALAFTALVGLLAITGGSSLPEPNYAAIGRRLPTIKLWIAERSDEVRRGPRMNNDIFRKKS